MGRISGHTALFADTRRLAARAFGLSRLMRCEVCQNRERSKPDIADKIRTAKSLSDRNKFIFVSPEGIPEATRQALELGGVLTMVFNEFVDFITKIDMNLTAIEAQSGDDTKKVRDAYSEWSTEGDYPDQCVKDPPPGWGEDDPLRPPR